MKTLTAHLPTETTQALHDIPDEKRRLLALRVYLRGQDHLSERWSWTSQQIERYEHSAEQQAANAELLKIKAQFEKDNPGYTLYVNSQVRSLDVQLARWNENPTVLKTANELWNATKTSCTHSNNTSSEQIEDFLKHWTPDTPASLAAPGLSRHGQARAFDFQIQRGNQIVLATETSAVKEWDRSGWTEKLHAAVMKGSPMFTGPLPVPREPWHYEYQPGG